ncbi:hypothetical protein ACWIGW_31795 [Nocardia brasiliensis]
MTRISVVTNALRQQADSITSCAEGYRSAIESIASNRLPDDALGMLGVRVVALFNQIAEETLSDLQQSQAAVRSAGAGIGECANIYDRMDAGFYRRYGYTSR